MSRPKLSTVFVLTAALALAAMPLRASDPVGVYCLIDKVVLEPNDAKPTAIQIWGTFSFAVQRSRDGVQAKPAGSFGDATAGDVYGPVQKGYLYYTCPTGKETECQNEWADLKSVAGKQQVVGFGTRWGATGSVRKAADRPASPDVYALNVGVVKMGSYGTTGMRNRTQYPDLVAALEAAARGK